MEIKVTLDAAPQFLNVLTAIATALTGPQKAVEAPKKSTKSEASKTEEVKETPVVNMADKADKVTEVKVTIEQIRQIVTDKAKTHKEKIKALLSEFGAANVSTLQKEQYPDFYSKVSAL
jgi:gas vesicle protein